MHISPTLILLGSVRERRVSPRVGAWMAEIAEAATGARPEVVDLRDWPLPYHSEPDIPAAAAGYASPHTRRWSEKIASVGALAIVTPQYNWGYPAPLKNALDHLYREWAGLPVLIVTYGGHGGDKCSDQLVTICTGLHMKPLAMRPQMRLPRSVIEANSGELEPQTVFGEHRAALTAGFAELRDAARAPDGASS